jgi:hypothetical protein
MTCIPVRSETVAEPPKINMDDTIMFVARLFIVRVRTLFLNQRTRPHEPEEHEHEMGKGAPSLADDFEESVRIGRVQLQLGCELRNGNAESRELHAQGSHTSNQPEQTTGPGRSHPHHTCIHSEKGFTWVRDFSVEDSHHQGPEMPYLYATALDWSWVEVGVSF